MLLCAAVEFGHHDLVSSLLESGFDINSYKVKPSPLPLLIACSKREKDFRIIETLLYYGADVHLRGLTQLEGGGRIQSALSIAVIKDDLHLLKILINACMQRNQTKNRKDNCSKKQTSDVERSLLHLASESSSINCIKYLLSKSPTSSTNMCSCEDFYQINELDPYDQQTPLMLGVHSLDIMTELLKQGADPNVHNQYGHTALWLLLNNFREFNPKTLNVDICERVELLLSFNSNPYEEHEGRCLLAALYSNISRGIVFTTDQYDSEQWTQVFYSITSKITKQTETQTRLLALMALVDELRNTVLYFPRNEATNQKNESSIHIIFCLVEKLMIHLIETENSAHNKTNQFLDRLTLVMFLNDRYNISEAPDNNWSPILQSLCSILQTAMFHGYRLQSVESLCNLVNNTNFLRYDVILEFFLDMLPHNLFSELRHTIAGNRQVFPNLSSEPRSLMQQSACVIRERLQEPVKDNRKQLGLPTLLQMFI